MYGMVFPAGGYLPNPVRKAKSRGQVRSLCDRENTGEWMGEEKKKKCAKRLCVAAVPFIRRSDRNMIDD